MSDDYHAAVEEITAVAGVSVDITVRGDEDRAEKVIMDLKERIGRLGAAYDSECPPSDLPDDLGEAYPEYVPMMTVAWDRVLGDDDE